MPLVVIGVLLVLAKMLELGPVGYWSWWIVLAPFGGAVLWWHFADTTGWTQRRAMDKMEKRKTDRRERAMEALGLDHKRERRVTQAREDSARRSSADPTQQADPPPPPRPEVPERREPRL